MELLAEALNKYEGSLILVSHDRFFVSKTANKIWEIVDHEIKEFKGTYTEYVEWKERMAKQAKEESRKAAANKEEPKKVEPVKNKLQEAPQVSKPRIDNTELKKLQNKFHKVEQELEQFKQEKLTIELALAEPDSYKNATKFAETEKSYKVINEKIKQAETVYEQLFEQIVELEG